MPDKKTKEKLDAILKSLPLTPGVYKFIGEDKVLYIGKAKNLKNRVKTYFGNDDNRSQRLKKLLEKVEDIEFIEVDSELEAFILETNLIKELHPKYNVLMKDDKNYAYIKVTQNEDYPRIEVVRQMEKDGARYFGPKTSATSAREMVDLLHKLFRFRNCKLGICAVKKDSGYLRDDDENIKVEVTNKVVSYPCLEYHIKRCDAPCVGRVTPEEYKKNILEIIAFLEGKHDTVTEYLKQRMDIAVKDKNFEYAARLRDKFLAIEKVQERQKISEANFESRDVISFVIRAESAFFNLFVVRDGKLINQENFVIDTKLKGLVDPRDKELRVEILERFMKGYYENTGDLPKEILVSEEDIDMSFLEEWLFMQAQFKVAIHVPKKGKKSKLLELSLKNAESFAKQCQVKWDTESARTVGACTDLAEALEVADSNGEIIPLKRIECFDISHISGHETVASMAVFENGKPKKSDYRHFTIKTLGQGDIDDFKSMEEVLARRLRYLKNQSVSKVDLLMASWKGYKLRKAKKDELKIVNEFKNKGGWNKASDVKGYFLLEDPDVKIVGLCCLDEKAVTFIPPSSVKKVKNTDNVTLKSNVIHHLKNVYIDENERGKGLGRFMISKVLGEIDAPVVYIVTGVELQKYYEEFGFMSVQKKSVPSELEDSIEACEKKYSGVVVMQFDKEKMYSKYGQLKTKSVQADGSDVMEFSGGIFKTQVHRLQVQVLDKKGAFISNIEISNAYKGRGIEFEVLEKVYKDIDASTFYIVCDEKIAEEYLKNGYEEIKTAPDAVLKNVGKGDVILAHYKSHQQKADASFSSFPDLIVIDGGKGQLSSAVKATVDSGVNVRLCSLAKKQEDIYVPGTSDPIHLEKDSNAQYLVQRIRDEAHRFAITHNRARREKEMLK
ncbi:MAG: GIY-YIG nuclease family protein [Candidatus Peregrinibacteria bacterium]|nr:GIY-YIG nuclease family protein [Candidatus Peregrinibacteria bacterium]MDZ4245230.1 GIY-YIG nuclease family protein [Candidatus Gracilibacteria bacterium]